MARSSYIYLILAPGPAHPVQSTYEVIAAFTVKHECQSFMEDAKGSAKRDWVVMRYPDSPYEREAGVRVTFDS